MVGHLHAKKLDQAVPTLTNLIHEQSFGWYLLFDPLDVV